MRAGVFIAILLGGALVASLANEATLSAAPDVPGLDPDSQPAGVAWLVKSEDGHFYAEAMVRAEGQSGSRVRFLVDTGASLIALTQADAQRIGLEDLAYTAQVRTANGPTRAAPVRLDRVTVSGVAVERVDAMVLEAGLDQSLLGMSYLGALSKMEASGEALILRR